MISWIIEWCAHNRFLVFTGVALLVFAGIWSVGHIPLDALPDISDVQVIIHTNWEGEPPNIIEDQVTYPIVTALLAAPRVKSVRAQTMFNDSYVFVVFEDDAGGLADEGVVESVAVEVGEGGGPVEGLGDAGALVEGEGADAGHEVHKVRLSLVIQVGEVHQVGLGRRHRLVPVSEKLCADGVIRVKHPLVTGPVLSL